MTELINFKQLSEWTNYKRPADVVAKLQEMGVHYEIGKNGEPFTTLEAINSVINQKGRKNEDWAQTDFKVQTTT